MLIFSGDLEEQAIASEQQMASLKKKGQDAANDLADQLDNLSKVKSKIEKEKQALKAEVEDAQGQLDHVTKGKQSAEGQAKKLAAQLDELSARLEDSSRSISDLGSQKSRAQAENAELIRKLDEAEGLVNQLTKVNLHIIDDDKITQTVKE